MSMFRSIRQGWTGRGSGRGLIALSSPQFMGVFYALGVLYCLLGLAEVCENFFVASLEELGTRFGLSEDVSGAAHPVHGHSLRIRATSGENTSTA